MLSEQECTQLLSEFSFENDVRKPPDNYRRRQFQIGWEDISVHERSYTPNTLKRLTWRNLGYRLGKKYGRRNIEEIGTIYESFAAQYLNISQEQEIEMNSEAAESGSDLVTAQIVALDVEDYKLAFSMLHDVISNSDMQMLKAHYESPDHTITATQLAYAVGFSNFNAANLRYGQLANKFCKFLQIYPHCKVQIFVIFEKPAKEWHWIMRPQVVQALHELAWFDKMPPLTILEEIEQCKETYETLEITSRAAIIQSRIGQGQFRAKLIDYWGGCAISGCKQLELLKASHIKPWRVSNNMERLDVYNGFLLLPNLDTCFDLGLISFTDGGKILISRKLDTLTMLQLGIAAEMKLLCMEEQHTEYLRFHREHIFQS